MNIYLPACKLSGKAYVLTLVTNCKWQLCVGHLNLASLRLFRNNLNRSYLSGWQCFRNESNGVFAVFNNINLFACKLFNNFVYTFTAGTDTSTDGVNFRISRINRNFSTWACLTWNRLNFNGTVKNFGYFGFEKAFYKTGMCAGKKNRRSCCFALYFK